MNARWQSKSRFRNSGMVLSAATLAVGAAALTSASAVNSIQYSGAQNISVSMAGLLDTTNVNLDFSASAECALNGDLDLKWTHPSIAWMQSEGKHKVSVVGETLTAEAGTVDELPAGTMIDSSSSFMASTNAYFSSGDGAGIWGTNDTAYFGFSFTPATTPLYGWGRMTRNGTELTLVDWAYDVTGAPISVGNTGLRPTQPIITSITFGTGNTVTIFFSCSDNSPPSSFTLETSPVLGNLAYWEADSGSTISYSTPSIYQAVTAATPGGTSQFYRISH